MSSALGAAESKESIMFEQIAEFYGLYLSRDWPTAFHTLGNYKGKTVRIYAFGMTTEKFRAICEAF